MFHFPTVSLIFQYNFWKLLGRDLRMLEIYMTLVS